VRKLLDLQHPFFVPLWRRVATVVVIWGWAGFELITGSPGWAILFGAVAAYCSYEFFVNFNPKDPAEYD